MEVLFVVLVVALTPVIIYFGFRHSESKVREALERAGLAPVTVKIAARKGTKYAHHVDFTARTSDGELVTGHAIKNGIEVTIHYDGGYHPLKARHGSSKAQNQVSPDAEMDLETRVLFETNQRLERMQGDRESFMNNDLNNDGMVDGEEWELARERVAAEVRAELTGAAAGAEPNLNEEVAEAEEPEVVEADGHW